MNKNLSPALRRVFVPVTAELADYMIQFRAANPTKSYPDAKILAAFCKAGAKVWAHENGSVRSQQPHSDQIPTSVIKPNKPEYMGLQDVGYKDLINLVKEGPVITNAVIMRNYRNMVVPTLVHYDIEDDDFPFDNVTR